jgi:hypothetical protein
MMFQAVLVIGAIAAMILTIATVVVVQRDNQANRARARRADQILGALHDAAATGRPWRSIYPAQQTRVSVGARGSSGPLGQIDS